MLKTIGISLVLTNSNCCLCHKWISVATCLIWFKRSTNIEDDCLVLFEMLSFEMKFLELTRTVMKKIDANDSLILFSNFINSHRN